MRKVRFQDLRTLAQELKFEKEKIKALQSSVADWEQQCRELESLGQDEDEGEAGQEPAESADSEWKIRFETQEAANKILESQVQALRKRVKEKKVELKEGAAGGGKRHTKSELTKLIIQLQREKHNLESQMKDYEWRIDREAELYHKAVEKRKAVYFDIKRQHQQQHPEPSGPQKKQLKPIKPGTLAKGSYVRKLLDKKASKSGLKPVLAIGGSAHSKEELGLSSGGSYRDVVISPPGKDSTMGGVVKRPLPMKKLPKITTGSTTHMNQLKLKGEGSQMKN